MILRSTVLALGALTPLVYASEDPAATSLPAGVRLAEFRELTGVTVEVDDSVPARKSDEPYMNARPDGRFVALAGGFTEFGVDCRLDPRLLDQAGRAGLDGRPGAVVYGFVGFDRRQTASRLGKLESLGVRFLGAFPPYARLAAMPIERLPEISTVPGVAFVGAARPEHKVHPELLRRLTPSSERFEAYICVFDDDRTEQMVTERVGAGSARRGDETAEAIVPEEMGRVIRSTGGWQERVLRQLGIESSTYLPAPRAFRVKLDLAQLAQVLEYDFVLSVQPIADPVAAHEESVPLISADVTRAYHSGLPNKFAIAGEIDSGLFAGHESLSNHAFYGWDYFPGSTSPWTDTCTGGGTGHGTHVAGTILGDPPLANQRFRGVTPQLCQDWPRTFRFVKAIGDNTCPGASIPFSTLASNMRGTIVVSGFNSPAPMVVNNSWGSGPTPNGWFGTEVGAIEIDDEVFTTGTTYVFAAHNYGPTTKSVCIEGSAKNAITVGNVTDFNSQGANGIEIPSKLYTGPSGSSRGPCADGRFKPTVTAPGAWVTSALGTGANHYGNKFGTSMATPHVTGVIAQLCDLYSFVRYRPAVAASMLMATANTPDDQPFDDPPAAWVNDYGAGRIDSYRAQFADSQFQLEPTNFTLLGSQSTTGNFTIGTGAKRLVIVFHYIEAAAAAGAAKALVNDLDLYLDIAPFSATINAGEWSSISGVNNTEMITVENPAAGSYQYKIHPYSVGPGASIKGSVTAHVIYGDPTPTPGILLTVSDEFVKPNDPVTVHGAVTNSVTSAEAIYFEAVDHTGATKILTTTTLADGIATDLTNNQNSVAADSGFDLMLGNVPHGTARSVDWTFRYATEGVRDFVLKAYRGGQMVMSETPITITVDGTAPTSPSNLGSSTHTPNVWSNNPNPTFTWTAASDNIGLAGYSLGTVPSSGTAIDDTVDVGPVTSWSTTSGTTSALYFRIKAVDQVGNVSSTATAGPYRIDLISPTQANGLISTSHTVGAWSTSKSVAIQWSSASDAHSGVAGYTVANSTVPSFTPPPSVVSVPAGTTNTVTGVSDAATNYIAVRTVDNAGNGAATWITIGPFKCDSIPPTAITGLNSPTHTINTAYSTNSSVTVNWNAANDTVSGLAGYVTTWSTSPNSEPFGGITTVATSETTILSPSALGWYFHVRARDVAGNLGATAHLGPFFVDDQGPFVGTFVVNSNAVAATSALCSLSISASNAASGLDSMRFKNDGGSFSPWQPYSGSALWQFTAFGGAATKGTRTVTAEIRDVAGNVTTVSDTIYYHDAPVTYGTACPGSLGVPNLQVTGPTGLGQTMTMSVSNTAATFGIVYLGFSKTNYLGLPLPIAIPGSGGCAINVSLDFQLWSGPVVALPLPVPTDPLLNGLTFHAQWFLTNDPIGHVVATRGVTVTLAGL